MSANVYRNPNFPKDLFRIDEDIYSVLVYDDFVMNDVEVEGWGKSAAGSGSGDLILSAGNAEEGHPGVVQISTGTASTGRCAIYKCQNAIVLGGGEYKLETIVKIPTLFDGTNDGNLYIGLHNGVTAEPGNGVYFEYDRDNSDNWHAVAAKATARTKTDTGVAVLANTYIKLAIVVNDDVSEAFYYINDELVTTVSTNLPSQTTSGGPIFFINKEAGTTARTLRVDWVRFLVTFSNDGRIG